MLRPYAQASLVLLAGLALSCGAADPSRQATHAPATDAPSPFGEVPILAGGDALIARHYGVNPTVDTGEEPSLAVSLGADRASLELSQRRLAQGQLPPPEGVRVESFINGWGGSPHPPVSGALALQAELTPALARPGYALLWLGVVARAEERRAPRRWRVLMPPAPRPLASTFVEVLKAKLPTGDTLAVGPGTQPGERVLRLDGATDGRPADDALVIGLWEGGLDDDRLLALAQTAGEDYRLLWPGQEAALAQALVELSAPAVRGLRVRLDLDPAQVERHRLLGYESRALRAGRYRDSDEGAVLRAGEGRALLLELKRRGEGSPGVVRLLYQPAAGGATREVVVALPTGPTPSVASGRVRLARVAAGLAEKLRGAYWARALSYGTLTRDLQGLSGAQAASLRALIGQAERLDRRGDRFEAELPQVGMDFDRLPVLSP